MDIVDTAGSLFQRLSAAALSKIESEGKGIFAAISEDGSKFFNYAEAKAHEDLLYIGKTIEAFGHSQVTDALNEVESIYPEARSILGTLVDRIRARQSTMLTTAATPKIDSVNAPSNIAATPTDTPPAPAGAFSKPECVYKTCPEPQTCSVDNTCRHSLVGAAPDKETSDTPPATPPAPSDEPERVQKPDQTRDPAPADPVNVAVPATEIGQAAVADALAAHSAPTPAPAAAPATPPLPPEQASDPLEEMKAIAGGAQPST